MSGYKNFAVVGAGNIGALIIEELLNAKSTGSVDKVVILSRPESASKLDAFKARGATIVPIANYSSIPDVSKALSGLEVVISTLTHNVLDLQLPIAEAAKSVGVQLFVPSEFGMATDNITEGLLAAKNEVNKKIRALGIPTALFFTGGFADWLWSPSINLDVKSGSVGVGGDGNAKISFTSRPDIGRYLAHVLTTLPSAETNNKTFRIEGEHASFNEVFAAYEKKHGTNVQVKYTPIEELQTKVKENPYDVGSILHLAWATGLGVVGSPLDNDAFPEWNPKPVIHYL
ncbi:NAD-P-binding protein [Peniophora sp. CONT]|nr:NAD-P-binding protein [Peniophora sp. CONT]